MLETSRDLEYWNFTSEVRVNLRDECHVRNLNDLPSIGSF